MNENIHQSIFICYQIEKKTRFSEVAFLHDYIEIIDKLIEKETYIIDFLPARVPAESTGQFF